MVELSEAVLDMNDSMDEAASSLGSSTVDCCCQCDAGRIPTAVCSSLLSNGACCAVWAAMLVVLVGETTRAGQAEC